VFDPILKSNRKTINWYFKSDRQRRKQR
jgi:hypothetical protein